MGITATAMSSLAMDPPSLLVCINQAAAMHGSLQDVSHFGVNVLHRDKEHLPRMFADRSQHHIRFTSGWELDDSPPPRPADATPFLNYRRINTHPFGTHNNLRSEDRRVGKKV